MEEILIFATILLPIITAVTELIKKTVKIKNNFIPAVSVLVGLAIGAAAYPFTDLDTVLRLWSGGLAGLAGTGLFELVKPREGVSK